MNEKWFALNLDQIEKKLKTNAASGLSRKAARSRRRVDEEEHFFSVPKKKKSRMLLELFSDFSTVILLIAAIFSLFFESELQTGSVIFVLLLFNFAISFAVYAYSQHMEEKHRESFQPTAKVIRGGKLYHVGYEQVVPGDVILIEAGDVLEADVRLITSERLKVYMQTDQTRYKLLAKYAEGPVYENENDACNMTNMLHAGSVVEEGSARGIVVAVGKYTYLGAMLQGIQKSNADILPRGLYAWKKIFSTCSMISLVSVLPLSILGLIGNKIAKGTGLLSTIFLTILSLSVCFCVAKIITCCKFFFVFPLRFSENKPMSVAVRSTEVLERLSGIDYLFLLDGSALTDGVLHCENAYSATGLIPSNQALDQNAVYFSELVALYAEAEKKTLSVSTATRNVFSTALYSYIEQVHVDVDALKIRCEVHSLLHGNLDTEPDRLYFTDLGQKKILSVFSTERALNHCDSYYQNGLLYKITEEYRTSLRQLWSKAAKEGKQILGFAISDSENGFSSMQCAFAGCLLLAEGVDREVESQIENLEQQGVKVITFRNPVTSVLRPEIPFIPRKLHEATREEFDQKQVPITYGFGAFNSYVGLAEAQILELLRFAKKQRKKVAVIGFTEFAPDVIKEAEVFISCASITEDSELRKNEIPGTPASASCTQTVKTQADILIERPSWGQSIGGLREISQAIQKGTAVCRNLNRFFYYILTAQLCRLLLAVVPILFGYPEIDARHLLFFGCGVDWLAFFLFATDMRVAKRIERDRLLRTTWRALFSQCAILLIATLGFGLLALLLPRIIGIFTDGYLYRIEFSFLSMILFHFVLLFRLAVGSWKQVAKNTKLFLILTAMFGCCTAFFCSCLVISPIGRMLEILKLPIIYWFIALFLALLLMLFFEFAPWLVRKMAKKHK